MRALWELCVQTCFLGCFSALAHFSKRERMKASRTSFRTKDLETLSKLMVSNSCVQAKSVTYGLHEFKSHGIESIYS